MANTIQDYLSQFKKSGITDKNKLKSFYDTASAKVKGTQDEITLKNAYTQYNSSLGVNKNNNTSSVTNKINSSNASSVIDRANELNKEGKISGEQYLTIKNTAQNIRNNDIPVNNLGDNRPETNNVTTSTTSQDNSTTSPTDINTSTTVDTSNINNASDASAIVTDITKSNIEATNKQQEEIKTQTENRIKEDEKAKEEAIKSAEDFAKQKEDLLKATDEKVKSLEDQISTLITERQTRDVADLEAKKASELDSLKAEQDLQKYKDEQVIKQAQKDIEVNNQKAAWAFNRLGLGFSSYAVSTVNRIATEGADKIAGLKLTANANQATFAKDIANLEFNYTKEINSTIDTYTDKAIELKNSSIDRIYALQNNLILNEKEKRDEINKVKDAYKSSIRNEEDKLYSEMERLRDKQLTQAQILEQQMVNNENTSKTKINDMLLNGTWNSLSSIQQDEYLKKANMTQAEVSTALKSTIYTQAYKLIQGTLGGDYLPSVAQMDNIQSEVNRMMLAGRTIDEAINIATNRVIKSTPEYNRLQASKIKKSSSGGGGTSTAKLTTAADILGFAKANKLNINATDAKSLANLDEETLAIYLDNMLANQQDYEEKQNKKEEADLASKNKPKLSTTGKSLLEDYGKNKDSTTKAQATYNELINSNYSPKGALDLMASQDSDLEVQEMSDGSYRLIDKDVFGDDTVLEGIK